MAFPVYNLKNITINCVLQKCKDVNAFYPSMNLELSTTHYYDLVSVTCDCNPGLVFPIPGFGWVFLWFQDPARIMAVKP